MRFKQITFSKFLGAKHNIIASLPSSFKFIIYSINHLFTLFKSCTLFYSKGKWKRKDFPVCSLWLLWIIYKATLALPLLHRILGIIISVNYTSAFAIYSLFGNGNISCSSCWFSSAPVLRRDLLWNRCSLVHPPANTSGHCFP